MPMSFITRLEAKEELGQFVPVPDVVQAIGDPVVDQAGSDHQRGEKDEIGPTE